MCCRLSDGAELKPSTCLSFATYWNLSGYHTFSALNLFNRCINKKHFINTRSIGMPKDNLSSYFDFYVIACFLS